jgi:hypothetical protein
VRSTGRYLLGLGLLGGAALALAELLPDPRARAGLRLALALAIAVQGPLGLWLVKSVGTPLALAVWTLGIAARVILVGITALVLVPAFGWPAEATLVGLASLLLAFLLLEGAVLMLEQSKVRLS